MEVYSCTTMCPDPFWRISSRRIAHLFERARVCVSVCV